MIEYALAKLWMAWGIRPQAMIGHSIGEYVAACLAGVFSLQDALMLVAARGRLMQELPGGAMLAVPLPESEIQPLLDRGIALAAVNGPALCVVAGPVDALDELEQQLAAKGVSCRYLPTSHAFHSQMMDPIVEPFADLVSTVDLQPPHIPYISNVTGTWIMAAEATDPAYWARHLRQPVRFSAGIHELLKHSTRIMLEVGPGQTLSRLVMRHPDSTPERSVLASLPHRDPQQSEGAFFLMTAGKLWLAGASVNWSGVHAGERRQRLPLPPYPLERRRYWVAPTDHANDGRAHQVSAGKQPDIADWFYVPSWKRALPPQPVQAGDQAAQPRRWLVFADGGSLSSGIVRHLTHAGQDVMTVLIDTQSSRVGDGVYTIDPRQRDSYVALLKELRTLDKAPDAIMHLWSLTANDSSQSGIRLFEQAQDVGFYSLLWLAQALGEQQITSPLRIAVVSNHMHDVTGEEVLCPEQATLLGACKVIPREYPNITCRSIDIVVPEPGSQHEQELIEQIAAEIDTDSDEPVIAYRGHHRWVQTFEPIRLGGKAGYSTRLREKGVYLITGGLGGIGLTLAEHLAQTVRARLILVGRTALPAKETWRQWQESHDEWDSVRHTIQKVQAIEALGAEVLVLSADVSNPEQMQSVITQSLDRFGVIHGVIHAAGVAGGGLIQVKTREAVESILIPKAKGLLVLDTLLKGMKLDFFVLFSSISAILGEFGQIDYCAANVFLDVFAHRNRLNNGTFTVSVDWDTWKEVGMTMVMAGSTSTPYELRELLMREIETGLTSKEGLEVFSRILFESAQPQIIVSTKDLQARIDYAKSFTRSRIFAAMEQEASSRPIHPRPNMQSDYIPPRDEIERTIADIWQQMLGVEPIGVQDNFFDLGGHSLLATMLVGRLHDAFAIDLPVNEFFEAPTVAGLALAVAGMQTRQEDQDRLEILQM